MTKKQIIKKVDRYVRQKLEGETTGHDFFHIDRVRKIALKIAKKDGKLLIVESGLDKVIPHIVVEKYLRLADPLNLTH